MAPVDARQGRRGRDGAPGGRRPVRPLVAGPPPRTGTALVNPSLETPGFGRVVPDDEQSDCWEEAGYGANSAAYARVADAHAGHWADQITVAQYSTGDAKVLVRQDLGTCSIPVIPGTNLMLSAWVKSSAPTRLVAFYRQGADQWAYAAGSPTFPPDPSWHQISWTTPAVPANAARMSFGVSVASVGAATVDDFGLVVHRPPNVVGESNRARLIAISGVVIVAIGLVLFWRRRVAARAAGPANRTGTASAADPSVGRSAPRQLGESRDRTPVARRRGKLQPALEELVAEDRPPVSGRAPDVDLVPADGELVGAPGGGVQVGHAARDPARRRETSRTADSVSPRVAYGLCASTRSRSDGVRRITVT